MAQRNPSAIAFRGPGLTVRQELTFSIDRGLEGRILRPYQFLGLGRRRIHVLAHQIKSVSMRQEFNPGAAFFLVLLTGVLVFFIWMIVFSAEFASDRLFWLVITALLALGVFELAGASWWAELTVKLEDAQPVEIRVAPWARADVRQFVNDLAHAVDRSTE